MITLLVSVALADQCSWISAQNAAAALEHLGPGREWLAFCEPCGDAEPVLGKVGRATVATVDGGRFRQVSIDGNPVDLAYTYVHAGNDAGFTNLAALVGCPATGVTRRVSWPPDSAHADRLASWLGTYDRPLTRLKISQYFDDPNGLAIQIDHPTEHPSMAATVVLASYVDVDADPLAFATPFGACRVTLVRATGGVELRPDASCAGLLDAIAGTYRKIGP